MQIHYEPHPVSRERKAELRAQGLKIIDARFAPAEVAPDPEPAVPTCTADIDNLGKADLREWLGIHGITPGGRTGAEKMREQLKQVMFMGAE